MGPLSNIGTGTRIDCEERVARVVARLGFKSLGDARIGGRR